MESQYAFEDGSLVEVDTHTPLFALIAAEEHEDHADPLVDCAEFGKIDPAAIKLVLSLLIPPDIHRKGAWNVATVRLATLAHAILPDLRACTITELADSLGVTKALVSYYTVRLRDMAGLSCAGGKGKAGREIYSARQKAIWAAKRRKI